MARSSALRRRLVAGAQGKVAGLQGFVKNPGYDDSSSIDAYLWLLTVKACGGGRGLLFPNVLCISSLFSRPGTLASGRRNSILYGENNGRAEW